MGQQKETKFEKIAKIKSSTEVVGSDSNFPLVEFSNALIYGFINSLLILYLDNKYTSAKLHQNWLKHLFYLVLTKWGMFVFNKNLLFVFKSC